MTRLYSLRLPMYCVAAVLAGLVAMAASPKPAEKPLWDILLPQGQLPDRPIYREWKRWYSGNRISFEQPDPRWMVNEFADFAERQSDTMYLIISHGRNYVYGWTSSGKKKLVQTPMRLPELMNTAERVSKYPYIKVIEKWDVKAIKNYEYDLDNGPSHGKFFPDMLFRVVYNKNKMSISCIYVNMDSIFSHNGYFDLIGFYENDNGGIAIENRISLE